MTETPAESRGSLALRSLLRADTVVLLRSRVATTLSLLLPVGLLVVTSFGKAGNRFGGPPLLIGLALTLGLVTSCLLGYSLGLARDREIGVLQRLRVTSAPTWMIMTSRIAVQVVLNLVASVIVVVVGVALHGLTLDVGQYLAVIALAALGAAVFLAIGQALVALVPSTGAVNAIGRILFIVLVLIGILGRTGVLGDVVKSISQWSPVGALITLFGDVTAGSSWVDQDWYSLAACVGYVVVFAFIGIRWFRWESR